MTSAETALQDPAQLLLRRRTPAERVRLLLHRHPAISPLAVLVAASLIFGLINHRFFLLINLSLVSQQVAVVGTLAVAETVIILTAGIDLSVGAAMILAQMIMARLAATAGLPGPAALALGIAIGTGAGLLNGALVTRIKLPPFIVTLGTFNIFTAIGLLYSQGQTFNAGQMPPLLTWTGTIIQLGQFGLSTGVLLMLALYAVTGYALARTTWGRHVYAIGDDIEAARLAGIRTTRVLLSVYVVAGIIIGLAAWILIGRVGAASPNSAVNANLDAITAVVIGGTSLFGGRGGVIGTLFGALIVGVFQNGLVLAGVQDLYQPLAEGILVIVAVGIDQWIRKVRR
jgi:fructose transport system permease protein